MFNPEEIKKWLAQLLDLMMIENYQIEINEIEPQNWRINIIVSPEDSGSIIGFRGDTLRSLQKIIRIIFNNDENNWQRLTLNVNDYLEDKNSRLQNAAIRAAYKVLETGRAYRFRSLNSTERFIIHHEISQNPEFQNLESYSEDADEGRVLIIDFKN